MGKKNPKKTDNLMNKNGNDLLETKQKKKEQKETKRKKEKRQKIQAGKLTKNLKRSEQIWFGLLCLMAYQPL